MTITNRSMTFSGDTRGFTLKDLRELVEETKTLPDDQVVSVVGGKIGADGGQIAYAVVNWKDVTDDSATEQCLDQS